MNNMKWILIAGGLSLFACNPNEDKGRETDQYHLRQVDQPDVDQVDSAREIPAPSADTTPNTPTDTVE